MASDAVPTGEFACEVTIKRIRGPEFAREEEGGVAYLVARDYEIAYETTLCFVDGSGLPVKARLFGELNKQVIIRDPSGAPVRTSGYVRGRMEMTDARGRIIFRGSYYDARRIQTLAGDEALTPTSLHVDHWENGFGEGPYAGRAFSMGVQLTRETEDGNPVIRGWGRGQID